MKPQYRKKIIRIYDRKLSFKGVIHIVRTHKGGGEGSSQMRTIAYKGGGGFQGYVRMQKKFFGPQNLKTFVFLYNISYYIAIYYCVYKSVNGP